MNLNLNGEEFVDNVLADHLTKKASACGLDEFVILEVDDQTYIQFYRDQDGTCLLEYRAGSEEKHFAESSQSITLDQAVAAMCGYLSGDESSWKSTYEWAKVDMDFAGTDEE